jgi:26S proteasome non-ATPase regulatory subunit 5
MWPVATDTVGLLSSSLQGREALIQQGIEATPVLPKLAEFVSQPKNDVRLRALRTFSQVFSCDNEEGTYDVSLSIGYQWYKLANVDLVTLVVAIIKQPFPDLHLVGLKFLLSLCQWKWGQMEMQRSPGFVEFLLDRRTETEKEGKELKYYIIRCLSESSFTERIFGSSLLLKFKDYVNEGPFYVKVETVVAFEDV